jgi:hypothetical protein
LVPTSRGSEYEAVTAFPKKLTSYTSEDDFIQRFLIPLLKRLGFSVVNYQGKSEHGRDLIFAEMDRFGHVRYHGLQAKYLPSIGLVEYDVLTIEPLGWRVAVPCLGVRPEDEP